MQEMTTAICNTATTPTVSATTVTFTKSSSTSLVPRTVLIDNRDNNKYLVSKLADGNCWMSQNLGLDLSTSKTLTNADTDLNSRSSWTPENDTQTTQEIIWNWDNVARSFRATSESGYMYFINATTWANSPSSTADAQLYEKIGNHYNFYAATAGIGTDTFTGISPDSICPYGWKLPEYSGDKSIYHLLQTTYGIARNQANISRVMSSPLHFIYAGRYQGNGTMIYEGSDYKYTDYRLNYVGTARAATDFEITSNLYYQDANVNAVGHSIRCVAR